MKSFLKTYAVPAALMAAVFASNFLLLSVPRLASADGGGKACQGGAIVAIAAYAWYKIKDTVGVPNGSGQGEGDLLSNRKSASEFINDCILKPLAQMMVVALIRNIGASIVNWVNTGFEGKPLFVTDFEGTVLDAADQAVGNFIENNSGLEFLCTNFSFKIRLALAMKYSQPFDERVRCTLTDISNNVNNFVLNNGGYGWDNWLSVTAEPTNNIYGAYLISESELAQRALSAAGVKEKRIALGQGFLDFETCDEYETQAEADARISGAQQNPLGAAQDQSIANLGNSQSGDSFANFNTGLQTVSFGGSTVTIPAQQTPSPFKATVASSKPQCKRSSTKTPGQVVAQQLNTQFMTGPIQNAVAQEIDQVISATLNQLAQKVIQGASGLLGLSQKRSTNDVSYLQKYRAQFYGQSTSAETVSFGATSELEDYAVNNYDESSALRNDPTNSALKNINDYTNTVGGAQIQAQENQFDTTVAAYSSDTSPEKNISIGKTATQSSVLNAASYGNDGVTEASQYIKGAETSSSEAGGWWEIDLGSDKAIQTINIFKNDTPSAPNGGLGTFVVEVKSASGGISSFPASSFSPAAGNSSELSATVNVVGRYVRITRQADEITCDQSEASSAYIGSQECFNQPHLAFAELQVMEKVNTPSITATSTSQANSPQTSNSSTTAATDTRTATSTLAWTPAVVSDIKVNATAGIHQEIKLSTEKTASNVIVSISLYDASGRNIPFLNIFQNFDISVGSNGVWTSTADTIKDTDGTRPVQFSSISQNSNFSFKITGDKRTQDGIAPSGNYSFITRISDSTGRVLEDKTQRINFVVE